jgi:hypothetical protein
MIKSIAVRRQLDGWLTETREQIKELQAKEAAILGELQDDTNPDGAILPNVGTVNDPPAHLRRVDDRRQANNGPVSVNAGAPIKRKISRAARAKMRAAAKKRWANKRAEAKKGK